MPIRKSRTWKARRTPGEMVKLGDKLSAKKRHKRVVRSVLAKEMREKVPQKVRWEQLREFGTIPPINQSRPRAYSMKNQAYFALSELTEIVNTPKNQERNYERLKRWKLRYAQFLHGKTRTQFFEKLTAMLTEGKEYGEREEGVETPIEYRQTMRLIKWLKNHPKF